MKNTNPEEFKPKTSPWLITFTVMMATFIDALNSSVANVALPQIAGSFSISNDESLWILTSFLIACSILLPASAWFCSIFGRKNFFMICLAMFGIGSFICGVAPNFEVMILARVLQGLGGGPLFPLSQAILLETFPKSEHGKANAIFGLGVVLAPVIGPILGGYLTTEYCWNWVFFISVPFVIIAFTLVGFLIEDPPYMRAKKEIPHIDIAGFILLITWLASFQTMLNDGQKNGWFESPYITKLGITALVSFVSLIWWELKNDKPLFDLRIFKNWNFAIGTIMFSSTFGLLFAAMAILPQMLQNIMGYTSYLSGLAAGPMGIGSFCGVLLAGILSKLIDLRKQIFVACLSLFTACLILSQLNLTISLQNVVLPNMLFGFSTAFLIVPLTTLSFAFVKNEEMTNASSLQNLSKNVASAIGSCSVGVLVFRFSQIHQSYLVDKMSTLNTVFSDRIVHFTNFFIGNGADIGMASGLANGMMYKQLLQQSTLCAFMSSYKTYAIATLCLIPLVFLLKKVVYSKNEN